jgi:hypothetical protein
MLFFYFGLQADLEFAKQAEIEKNPAKHKDTDPKSQRVFPALSSIDLNNEQEVANNLIACIDGLYQIIQFDVSLSILSIGF